MPRQCDVLRVFTRGEAGGNYLGVVSDRSGLDTDAMQAVAADWAFPRQSSLNGETIWPPSGFLLPAPSCRSPAIPWSV